MPSELKRYIRTLVIIRDCCLKMAKSANTKLKPRMIGMLIIVGGVFFMFILFATVPGGPN